MLFILLAIMERTCSGDGPSGTIATTGIRGCLALGIISMVGGLGLAVYALFLVRRMDQEKIS